MRIAITRAIPYDSWNPDFAETFKNTLNLNPFIHGGLKYISDYIPFPLPPAPVYSSVSSPPGEVKLTSITAKRMVRLQNISPAAAKYYWQVRAVLDFDKSLFVDNNGNRQFRRWRRVLIDAGYNERILGQPKRIVTANNGSASSGPTLLDGTGRRLFLPVADPLDATRMVFNQTAPELPVVQRTGTDLEAAVPEHDWYACRQGTKLTVKAPGVRANDYNADAATAVLVADVDHGALTLNSDGGFVYTSPSLIPPPPPPPPPGSPPPPPPAPPFVGWVTFTYKLVYATGESNPATACILVGPVPKVRVFEDYEYKDWTTITTIIGNW